MSNKNLKEALKELGSCFFNAPDNFKDILAGAHNDPEKLSVISNTLQEVVADLSPSPFRESIGRIKEVIDSNLTGNGAPS